MDKWKCPRCGEWFDLAVVAVDKYSRKNKRGRIAWLRDGICPKCAAKGKVESDGKKIISVKNVEALRDGIHTISRGFVHDVAMLSASPSPTVTASEA